MTSFVSIGLWNIVVTIINTLALGALLVLVVWLLLRRRAKTWKCPSCGKAVQPHYRICPYCGADLQDKEERHD